MAKTNKDSTVTLTIVNRITLFAKADEANPGEYIPTEAVFGSFRTKKGLGVLADVPPEAWEEGTETASGGAWFQTTNDWKITVAVNATGWAMILGVKDTGREHETVLRKIVLPGVKPRAKKAETAEEDA